MLNVKVLNGFIVSLLRAKGGVLNETKANFRVKLLNCFIVSLFHCFIVKW
jgi:hypothetical protein